jgi:hypothetical protein
VRNGEQWLRLFNHIQAGNWSFPEPVLVREE